MGSNKILIAVDGSDQSFKAFSFYLDHLHKQGNLVILAHVADTIVQPSFGFRAGLALPREEWQAMLDDLEDRVKKIKAKFGGILTEKHIAYKFVHDHGDPGHVLTELAKKEDVDLCVMGTRGLGTVRRTVLGSVSDYMLHHVHAPVIICRDLEDTHDTHM